MQLFYAPNIQSEKYELSEVESKHCAKVLRKKESDIIDLIDGEGYFYKAEITLAHQKHTAVKILEKRAEEKTREYKLHIAIAPTKNIDRFEWFLEKCTEIGIDEITPLLCEHSERKVIKEEKLAKRILSAVKQSLKAKIPKLNPLTKAKDFITSVEAENKYIAHCYSDNLPELKKRVAKNNDIIVMIGPEGDFSPKEVELAKETNFEEISLGKSRLRTETAGLVACSIANVVL